MDINTWAKAIFKLSQEKGWWPTNPEELRAYEEFAPKVLLMMGELSEATEEYRNGRDLDEIYYKDGKPEGIPIELADAVIRILDYCAAAGIDIETAMKIKHDYNKTRPHRHGGKIL